MPYKPKIPCKAPGCPELVEPGQRFCPKHKAEADRIYRQQKRDPRINSRYHDYAWIKVRKEILSENPFCAMCRAEGRLRPATVVHHILPLAEGGTHEKENLIPLCKSCHSRIHVERGDNGARQRKVYRYD